jgi:predicted permease
VTPAQPSEAYPRQAAIYRRLLRILPAPALQEYGDDMAAIFCHHLEASGGSPLARARVWIAALGDLARHGPGFPRNQPSDRSPRQDSTMTERLRSTAAAIGRDAAFGLRLLRKDWTFTLAATLILALAIGVNTAVFSFVDAYILRPLPYPEPQDLALVTRVYDNGSAGIGQDGRTWEAIRNLESEQFDATPYSNWITEANLATGDRATTVRLQRIGAGYFSLLGVLPRTGRDFAVEDDLADGPGVAIVSYSLARTLFKDPDDAVGKSILLRGEPHDVVGVMPADFTSSANAEIWAPLRASTSGEGSGTNYMILARLRSGASRQAGESELQGLALALNADVEDERRRFSLGLDSLQVRETAMLRVLLMLLAAAVGTVLLVACVNVSGLLLARGARRSGEIATRMAIGGGRAAIVRQFLMESIVLALAGGLAGLVVARVSLQALAVLGGEILGAWRPVTLDARVLAATIAISLTTAVIFGLAPAFQAGRISVNDVLRNSAGRGMSAGSHAWRRFLVVGEVALSVVLLVAAGLLLRTFLHLQNIEPGFEPDGLVSISVSLQDARYETREEIEQLFASGLESLRGLPEVASATAALGLPYQRLLNMPFEPRDFSLDEGRNHITNMVYATSGYFETLRVPILAGRGIEAGDTFDAPPVAVVNEAFVNDYLPGKDAIGHTLSFGASDMRIVGVAATVRQRGSWGGGGPVEETPVVFVSPSQLGDDFFGVVHTWFAPAWIVRVNGPTGAAVGAIEQALAGVDPLLPLAPTKLGSDLRVEAVALQRITAQLVGAMAATAIFLAALGIYGLVAGTVAERRRDIGIRLALGAHARDAVKVIIMPTIRLALIGSLVGIVGSIAAGRALRSLLWGIAPTDPWTYAGVVVALLAAAGTASLLPAARAARLDPAQTLRDK